MLKKLSLLILFSISSLQAANVPKVNFITRVKNSKGVAMWFGSIIPSILSFVSLALLLKESHLNNREKDNMRLALSH